MLARTRALGLLCAFGGALAGATTGCSSNNHVPGTDTSDAGTHSTTSHVTSSGSDAGKQGTVSTCAVDSDEDEDAGSTGNIPKLDAGADEDDTHTKCNVPDDPDDDFTDTNCDGIDGDKAKAIFVATTGSDSADGSLEKPVATVNHAIALASSHSKDVYVCAGVYKENAVIDSKSVRVYGGYDCTKGWVRNSKSQAHLMPASGYALTIKNATAAVVFDRIDLEAANARNSGESSVAVFVSQSSNVTLRRGTYRAGDGATAEPSADVAAAKTSTVVPKPGNNAAKSAQCGVATDPMPSCTALYVLSGYALASPTTTTWNAQQTPSDMKYCPSGDYTYGGGGGTDDMNCYAAGAGGEGYPVATSGTLDGLDGSDGTAVNAATLGYGILDAMATKHRITVSQVAPEPRGKGVQVVEVAACISQVRAAISAACSKQFPMLVVAINNSRPECILSADCPAGVHCDLGECIQDCNTDSACTSGNTCSARARCLGKGQSDIDPKPPSDSAGTLDVSPLSVKLTRANNGKVVNLTLSTKATTEVQYRAQVDAPYLSIDKPRGSFTKETTLPIKVNTANIVASDMAGSVTLYTTLGSTVVQLPLRAGLTGRYHGSLRYNGGAIPLGDTRFDLDIIEDNGDVSARVAPQNSMLFPQGKTANDVAYGFGSLSGDGVVDLTVEHLLDAAAGGKQNLLGRQVGRRIILRLNSPSTGVFDGSFTESIYGLFQSPVTTSGAAHLEFMPDAVDPNFQVKSVPTPSMTSSTDLFPLSMSSVFHPSESSPCAVSYANF